MILLLLFCFYYHVCADQWLHFNVAIRADHEEEMVNMEESVNLPMAIFSRFVAGMAGGCGGEYVASHYDFSEQEITMAAVASSVASMITIGLLLQNQKVARTVNSAYESCMRKYGRLAESFING